jgi:hypothetical protein
MRTIAVLSLATLAIATGAALSPALRAEEAPTPQRPGMMDHGAMSQMMDQCNRMMQSMDNSKKAPAPNPDSK